MLKNIPVTLTVLVTIAALIGLALIIVVAVLEPKPYYQRQRTQYLHDNRTPSQEARGVGASL